MEISLFTKLVIDFALIIYECIGDVLSRKKFNIDPEELIPRANEFRNFLFRLVSLTLFSLQDSHRKSLCVVFYI